MALIDLLPENYLLSSEVMALQNAIDYFTEAVKDAKSDLFNQFDVETATWGLALMEENLQIKTDVSLSEQFRRERIKAKLRGSGTITKSMIEQTAKAYSGGEVEIIENPKLNSFIVKFIGTLGRPDNLEGLTLTIEEIKPAHLSYTFEFIYNTNLKLSAYTHAHLSGYTHEQLREGVIS